MRGQSGYAAIAMMLGIAAAHSNFHIGVLMIGFLYLCYCIKLSVYAGVLCMVTFLVSSFYAFQVNETNKSIYTGMETTFTGTLTSSPVFDGDRLSFQFQTKETLQVFYRIPNSIEKKQLQYLHPGMRCSLRGTLRMPSPARNFYAFDYKQYLFQRHIHYQLIPDTISIERCTNTHINILSSLYSLRQAALSHVQLTFPEQAVGFMNALIFGDRAQMTEKVETQYQALGLVHLLAISGSHISLLTAMCYYILLRLGMTRETATVTILLILPVYMVLAGASPSVIRACVTACIVLCCFLFASTIMAIDVIGIVCMLMLLYNPYVLFDAGFQLSFLVSFALILSSKTILSKEENSWKTMWKVTIIAQLIALPIILYHFHQFSPYSLVLNMIYVPLISFFILPLCLCAFVLSFLFPMAAKVLAQMLSFVIVYSNKLLDFSAKLPFSSLTFENPSIWIMFLYFIVIICLFITWEGEALRRYARVVLSMLLLLICSHYYSYLWSPYGKVTFIDVGQGDSILIQLPFGRGTYLIDTGGVFSFPKEEWQQRKKEYTVGRDTVLPYLKAEGIKVLDKLILTHGDMDHVGGTKELLEQIPIKEILIGKKEGYSELEQEIVQKAVRKKINIATVGAGEQWKAGEAVFTVISPSGNEAEGNDSSIVLHAVIGGLTWLFTGDLEEAGERNTLERSAYLRADVLKVGHHGSKSSTTDVFLQRVQPKIAVISAGERNRYGHPHEEVLTRLKSQGIIILRTDQNGAIAYNFLGEKGTFQSAITYDENN
ncbi:DNA internalization-related competence protein ComEC/Rec2 [Bacillus sp. 165]|uniref:DNA internalization-related competence protein ComEC/Rec2 n=1 Tax=Bacillus sp. 165 TaxID=1529117 RepID=UPI001ADA3986|nr:DNA internalization-related competence protein ComEC/Rec2 [Bacillus sp. 165]MBO9129577.1 DNA internalization-related competence protein ComEC/Rec2 [Bacillus sp. 165]